MRNAADRTSPRITPETPLRGQANGTEPLSILNVSRGGAMIEHRFLIRPGTIIHLKLPFDLGGHILRSRVAWSSLMATARTASGGKTTVYRSGLEFLDPVSGAVETLLSRSEAELAVGVS